MMKGRSIFVGLAPLLNTIAKAAEPVVLTQAKKRASRKAEVVQPPIDVQPDEATKMSDNDLAHALRSMRLRRG